MKGLDPISFSISVQTQDLSCPHKGFGAGPGFSHKENPLRSTGLTSPDCHIPIPCRILLLMWIQRKPLTFPATWMVGSVKVGATKGRRASWPWDMNLWTCDPHLPSNASSYLLLQKQTLGSWIVFEKYSVFLIAKDNYKFPVNMSRLLECSWWCLLFHDPWRTGLTCREQEEIRLTCKALAAHIYLTECLIHWEMPIRKPLPQFHTLSWPSVKRNRIFQTSEVFKTDTSNKKDMDFNNLH